MAVLRERRLPWKLRWLKYIRPGKPLVSLRVVTACLRDSPALSRLLLHQFGPEFLTETLQACTTVGMTPFLAFGTLLGHYRDNGFIKHDADIDLGLFEADFAKRDRLRTEMARLGYTTRISSDREISFYKPEFPTLLVDFFLFRRKGASFVYNDSRGDTHYEFSFADDIFSELVPVKFCGHIDAWIPKGTERFLEASYGEWRTPKEDFHNVDDHPNVKIVPVDSNEPRS